MITKGMQIALEDEELEGEGLVWGLGGIRGREVWEEGGLNREMG